MIPSKGLVTKDRENIDSAAAPYARGFGPEEVEGLREGASLFEVVKKVKPHVILGLSGVGGIFDEQTQKSPPTCKSRNRRKKKRRRRTATSHAFTELVPTYTLLCEFGPLGPYFLSPDIT